MATSARAENLKSFVVRKLEPADGYTFLELRIHGMRESPLAFFQTYEEGVQSNTPAALGKLRTSLLRRDSFVLGVFAPTGGLVGVGGWRRAQGAKIAHKSELWGLYVRPEHRGEGIGRTIVDHIIRFARVVRGVEVVTLAVVTENFSARALFEKSGFATYGVERRGLRSEGRFYDIALMSRPLP